MFIYHYSDKFFHELRSKRKQGILTKQQILEMEKSAIEYFSPAPYCDSISFFFDPIPSELMSDIYPKDHSVWVKGKTLFEYVIDVNYLEKNIQYKIAESKKKTEFLDKEFNFNYDDDAHLKDILKRIRDLQTEWKEIGNSRNDFIEKIKENKGNLSEDILTASKRKDFEDNKYKYAANVPHVMLYPTSGIIGYKKVNLVTIGKNERIVYNGKTNMISDRW